jgi:peptidoglycan/xylan/chitin deacetylase (PgdA/CDA1 family)
MRAILTYHSIDGSGSPISIDERVFRDQMAWLSQSSVRVVTLDRLMRTPQLGDAVALTFDDAFENFGNVAAPVLAGLELPATVFVVAGAAGGTNRWSGVGDRGVPQLPLLGWESLARLAEQGFTLGAHSVTHPDLRRLSGDRLLEEIAGSSERIRQETGHAPTAFAYPYGHITDEAVRLVEQNFEWGCTTDMRALEPNEIAARLPRLEMFYFRGPGQLEQWGSARFRYRVTVRAGARRVRRHLMSLRGIL